MDVSSTRPVTEPTSPNIASMQQAKFKERRAIEAQSDVRNQAVYFSPVVKIDPETRSAVLQYRDTDTGKVESEYPKRAKTAYMQAEETAAKAISVAGKDKTDDTSESAEGTEEKPRTMEA